MKISALEITFILGILIIGFLSTIYCFYKIRKGKIKRFIVKGSKEIKRLHYILKINKFKIIDVNRNFRFKVFIDNRLQKIDFNIIALVKKKKKPYACFIQEDILDDIDYEMFFKTIICKCTRGLIIDPELFSLSEYKLKLKRGNR